MDARGIAEVLEEIGQLLELKGENPFKVRAYQNGARALESLEQDLCKLIDEGKLGEVKGIGKALVDKITALYRTGQLDLYDRLRAETPNGLLLMLEIPGFGPKKARKVHEVLGIASIEELTVACEDGRLAALPGMGDKTAQKLLKAIEMREKYNQRHLWEAAAAIALPLLEQLRARPEVERAEVAGSFRRRMETVGDLDFIAASDTPGPIMQWLAGHPDVAEVTAQGETKTSVRFATGLQADLRVVPPHQFPFALHHFTGSKDHNVAMRQRALARGLTLGEWGLFPVDEVEQAQQLAPRDRKSGVKATTEAELFAALDLAFIPPELREGRGEIEAAERGDLPRLIEPQDLKGAFHNHTTASDGRATLEEMTAAAEELGWDFLGIADHSKSSWQARGLEADRLLAQVEAIRELNASGRFRTRVLAGSEVDILTDGSLDFPDEVLNQLDYIVMSVHQSMNQEESIYTARVLKAIRHPLKVRKILGHMTGRLLLRREPSQVDHLKIIEAAAAEGVAIELNANPWRLDMDWRWWRLAQEKGVRCTINPDAHSTDGLAHVVDGVRVGRKGWLRPETVVNTWELPEILAWLERK
ncbi:MAG: DNA polymerase/3'-5' exonuclease PolX [Verrucomicrobiota bacterium JB022]|nr:DNA polymerase/3'-5' exonuclease PolX [Verrucomicrobiota bacterium JB022]